MQVKSSKDLFRMYWFIWKTFGITPTNKYRTIYLIYSGCYHLSISLFNSFTLVLGTFMIFGQDDFFSGLSIGFTYLLTTAKLFIFFFNFTHVRRMEDVIEILENRIRTKDEKILYKKVLNNCKLLVASFATLFTFTITFSELSTVCDSQRRLMYPAWFPIDVTASMANYLLLNAFQLIALICVSFCNLGSDTYGPACMCLLGGHTRILALRVSNLGKDQKKSIRTNNIELRLCIKDHERLIELYHCMQRVISKGMFLQVCSSSVILCCTACSLLTGSNDLFSLFYFCLFFLSASLEIFPCCYFGSRFEEEFVDLSHAMYCCNWVYQDAEFRKNVITFSQRSLQPVGIVCMRMFNINLNTFVVALKSTYSLFAVVLQTR